MSVLKCLHWVGVFSASLSETCCEFDLDSAEEELLVVDFAGAGLDLHWAGEDPAA